MRRELSKRRVLSKSVAARNFRQLRGAHADDVVRPTCVPKLPHARDHFGAMRYPRDRWGSGSPFLELRRAARVLRLGFHEIASYGTLCMHDGSIFTGGDGYGDEGQNNAFHSLINLVPALRGGYKMARSPTYERTDIYCTIVLRSRQWL